jgi:replicative DNA helicase
MQIQLDDKTKAEIIAQAKKQLLAELMSQFNVKQIAAEIRNAAVNKAAQELAKEMWKSTNADRHLNRALASVNDRLEARIQEVLAKGIKVQFNGLVPDKEGV